MDKAKDEAINKLIAGQEKMGKDISELKANQQQPGADWQGETIEEAEKSIREAISYPPGC